MFDTPDTVEHMGEVRELAVAAWKNASVHQAPLLAAGVAFYSFLSLFPALIAAVLIYGLVADANTVARQSKQLSDALPADAASLISGQLVDLASTPGRSLGYGLVFALLLAIYSASSGVGQLVTAINAMFSNTESRNFIRKKALALALTAGALAFVTVLIGVIAAAPILFDALDVVPGTRIALEFGRWGLLVAALVTAIGLLFRIAPDMTDTTGLFSRGVLVASALWIVVSVGFSLYVDNFGRYASTYGALAGVVVLSLWLWIGLYAILLGASVEAVTRQGLATDVRSAD